MGRGRGGASGPRSQVTIGQEGASALGRLAWGETSWQGRRRNGALGRRRSPRMPVA